MAEHVFAFILLVGCSNCAHWRSSSTPTSSNMPSSPIELHLAETALTTSSPALQSAIAALKWVAWLTKGNCINGIDVRSSRPARPWHGSRVARSTLCLAWPYLPPWRAGAAHGLRWRSKLGPAGLFRVGPARKAWESPVEKEPLVHLFSTISVLESWLRGLRRHGH
jgi:hypothetical protein